MAGICSASHPASPTCVASGPVAVARLLQIQRKESFAMASRSAFALSIPAIQVALLSGSLGCSCERGRIPDEGELADTAQNTVDNTVNSIASMDVAFVELQWRVNTPEGQALARVFIGNGEVTRELKACMDDVVHGDGEEAVYVWIAATGVLTVEGKNGSKVAVDVTEIGFFPEGTREASAMFFSPSLSRLVQRMLENYSEEKDLMIGDRLFEALAGRSSE